MLDILSGAPNSGFPGRRVRKLSRATSLGAESQAASTATSVTMTPEKGQGQGQAKNADGLQEAEVLSQSEEETA